VSEVEHRGDAVAARQTMKTGNDLRLVSDEALGHGGIGAIIYLHKLSQPDESEDCHASACPSFVLAQAEEKQECKENKSGNTGDVKAQDAFWIKSQPYSLKQLLDGHFVDQFVGGTVYQAFLSAENYHRWHSPVSGIVKMIRHVEGAYYAEAASEGFDPLGPNNSQGYIGHVNTRALIFIEADEAAIGLLCLIAVGMVEVSSCVVSVKEGQRVKKGEEIGFF